MYMPATQGFRLALHVHALTRNAADRLMINLPVEINPLGIRFDVVLLQALSFLLSSPLLKLLNSICIQLLERSAAALRHHLP